MSPAQIIALGISVIIIFIFFVQLYQISYSNKALDQNSHEHVIADQHLQINENYNEIKNSMPPSNSIDPWLRAIQSLDFIRRISDHERLVFSQNGEDGVIEVHYICLLLSYLFLFKSLRQYIFDNMGTTDKYYVEFGVEDGVQCVTRNLWKYSGWVGI